MERIEIEKSYPQKVEVVNPLEFVPTTDNPVTITFPSSFVSTVGGSTSLRVLDSQSTNAVYIRPSSGNTVNGFISCVHVVNNNFGYVFPINQNFYNIANVTTFVSAIVPSLHSSFEQEFPSASSIIVFYSYQNSQRAFTFGSYSGQS